MPACGSRMPFSYTSHLIDNTILVINAERLYFVNTTPRCQIKREMSSNFILHEEHLRQGNVVTVIVYINKSLKGVLGS